MGSCQHVIEQTLITEECRLSDKKHLQPIENALALHITYNLVSIITNIFNEKNAIKIIVIFLQRNDLPSCISCCYRRLRLPVNALRESYVKFCFSRPKPSQLNYTSISSHLFSYFLPIAISNTKQGKLIFINT